MKLIENVYTDDGWDVHEKSLDPEQIVTTGSTFMIGNGYLGYRGTLSEWRAEQYTACIVTDTWDTAQPGALTELCTVPNGLYLELSVDTVPLSAIDGATEVQGYERRIDLRTGLFSRHTRWASPAGGSITLGEERLAHADNVHLIASRFTLIADRATDATVRTGIDADVWSLSGNHFARKEAFTDGELSGVSLWTVESGTQIVVVEGVRTVDSSSESMMRRLDVGLEPGGPVTIEKVVAVYHGNDTDDPRACAVRDARRALSEGFDTLYAAHSSVWQRVWAACDIEIEGDLEAQTLARFNLFHNIIHTPTHARLPIGARGLSSQVYQGAAFWDQETFNLPMFVYTRPDVARSILEYRYDTLPGARRKAERLGYRGAYYAWTSGKTGDELFPDVFFTDVLTGRPIRNHFNCWQIHISPDVVYAIDQYLTATDDWDFIERCGAEIAFEVARFIVSRSYFKKDKNRFELIRLLGPDEYHENVDNNAYTMYLSKLALETAVRLYDELTSRTPQALARTARRIDLTHDEVAEWREHARLFYLPTADPVTRLIEQFDGYFSLEDITPDHLRERLIHPEEYWGWPAGIAVRTQVLKQADVLQLFALVDSFPPDVMRANYEYYEPRTEHGSSLSPSIHSIVACGCGLTDEAYRYFHEAATIDLYNRSRKVKSGGSFLGGIHTAACGGVWMMIVQGFAGFRVSGDSIELDPGLPETWKTLAFRVCFRGNTLSVTTSRWRLTVSGAEENSAALSVRVSNDDWIVSPGETVQIDLPRNR